MADDTRLNLGTGGDLIVTDSLGGVPERKVQGVKIMLGGDGVDNGYVASGNPLPVTGTLTLSSGSRVQGIDAHDAPLTTDPVLEGGRASAAAPADVSADGDAVRGWRLRNGAAAVVLTAAGALLGGDATFGLDVDVTRISGTVTTQDSASLADNAAFTDGSSRVLPSGYILDEVAGTALTENDVAAARIDSKRAIVNVLEDAATRGQRLAINAGGALEAQGDVAHDAVGTGVNPLLVGAYASAAAPTSVSADGDAVRLWALRNGALATVLTAAGALIGGDATNGLDVDVTRIADALVEGSTFSFASNRVFPMGGVVDEIIAGSLAEHTFSLPRISPIRQLVMTVEDAAGGPSNKWAISTGGAAETHGDVAHDAVGTSTNPLLGGGYASAAAPSDVSADGDAVRRWHLRNGATVAALVSGSTLIGVGNGTNGTALRVTVASDSTGTTVVTQATAANLNAQVQGTAASDAPVSGNPVLGGGRASTATPSAMSADGDAVALWLDRSGATVATGYTAHDNPVAGNPLLNGYEARTTDGTAVGSGDVVRGLADTLGKQVVLVGATHDRVTSGRATFSNTTAADVIAAAGAGVRIVVTKIGVTNTNASVATKVEIRDGTTVKLQLDADVSGGGFVLSGDSPIFISTANTAITARCVTNGADVDVFISGYLISN